MGMDDETFSGKYSIIESVGKGGMAEVFLVENLILKRKEALKVMLPEAAGDVQLAQRFLREAQALAQMKTARINRAENSSSRIISRASMACPSGGIPRFSPVTRSIRC